MQATNATPIAEFTVHGESVHLTRYTDGLFIETALHVPGLTFPLQPATLADAFRMLADIAADAPATTKPDAERNQATQIAALRAALETLVKLHQSWDKGTAYVPVSFMNKNDAAIAAARAALAATE
jgi:hypothetical protein